LKSYDSRQLESGLLLRFWNQKRFDTALKESVSLETLANACRLNILASIKAAGSGHIGTSFSSIELLISIRNYLSPASDIRVNSSQEGIFFSSKGHDAPAIYSVMHMLGELTDDEIFTLRRLNGLPGHPEIDTPGIPTNTGSLGMGISKAKGFVHANRINKIKNKVVVLLGDGEMQEGQIWESMPTAARDSMSELVVVVDGNKIQSDSWVENTSSLHDLQKRVEGSGWNYLDCDGHNFSDILNKLKASGAHGRPTLIYASTIKGCGVGFMRDFPSDGQFYKFHSGSIPDDLYNDAVQELILRIDSGIDCTENLSDKKFELASEIRNELNHWGPKDRPISLLSHWAELLPKLMAQDDRIIVLDADLSYDTGTYGARSFFPDRYIQAGIAEQDMVSMAGTIALSGKIPIVHSFSSFLSMRPTEQIFNNATERSRIIYMGFLAGLLPSPPGFSHQALTDVGIFASLPNIQIIEPTCRIELQLAIDFARDSSLATYIRITSLGEFNSTVDISNFSPGSLIQRKFGNRFAIVCSGPWLTHEAVEAAKLLGGDSCAVYTYPFLNSIATKKTLQIINQYEKVLILENHSQALAAWHNLSNSDQLTTRLMRLGVDGIPKNGWNEEVLKFHGLDAVSIAKSFK
jgi:transketolase